MKVINLPTIEPEEIISEIGSYALNTCLENGKTGYVIGLSGGVDSTVSAAIVSKYFKKYNKSKSTELEVVGLILPSSINDPEDAIEGVNVAEELGIRYEVINIEAITEAHIEASPELANSVYHKGNAMSRIRAGILSDRAALENKLVLGTGNKDEDYGIGYYTLFGDGAVHLSPIGNLSKRLVNEMAKYMGFKKIACREPTAGLEPGQSDHKDLGYSYDFVELISCGIEQGFSQSELLRHPQIVQLAGEEVERYKDKFGESKWESYDQVIGDFFRRHEGAKKKVEIISPPVVPITYR